MARRRLHIDHVTNLDGNSTYKSQKRYIGQLHKVVSTRQIRIDPKFKHTITALRTATNKPNGNIWELDESLSASNDVLDALRLSLLCLRSVN
jgi:hypothetical protein